jgi:hypothetical protein
MEILRSPRGITRNNAVIACKDPKQIATNRRLTICLKPVASP